MCEARWPEVAIVDYGMGNLFSIQHALAQVELRACITASGRALLAADAVVLPGVGAFGDAMRALQDLDLVSILQEIAASPKPVMGVCLGMQLLMTGSAEFGWHQGLGVVRGEVLPLREALKGNPSFKVPHVGWNRIHAKTPAGRVAPRPRPWEGSLLEDLTDGAYVYFAHSFYPAPEDPGVILSITPYGPAEFCSSLRQNNVFGFQFHPERSGPDGLRIYRTLAGLLRATHPERGNVGSVPTEVRPA